MNTNEKAREDRSQNLARLRKLTIGTAALGVAATTGFGYLAAMSYNGATTTDTAAAMTTTTTASSATSAPTPAATSSTSSSASTAPTVSASSGAANVSTGGS